MSLQKRMILTVVGSSLGILLASHLIQAFLPEYYWTAQSIVVLTTFAGVYLISAAHFSDLQGSLAYLVDSVDDVMSNSVKIAGEGESLQEMTSDQASSLQETASCVDEISAMVARNSESAQTSSKESASTLLEAESGRDSVRQMVEAIENIATSNATIVNELRESHKRFEQITDVITSIGDKTNVINDIVFQTKLLSFNASVEAARAGEHGKGFAVVAEEVGNLAVMSGRASTDITNLLNDSLSKVRSIVDDTQANISRMMALGNQRVEDGKVKAQSCAKSFEKIAEAVREVNDSVKAIAVASKEQSVGIEEVTRAMARLEQISQSSTAIFNNTNDATKKLASNLQSIRSAMTPLCENLACQEVQNRELPQFTLKPVETLSKEERAERRAKKKAASKKSSKVVQMPEPQKVEAPQGQKTASGEYPDPDDPRFEQF